MTDKTAAKRKERARNKAGWVFLSGYTTADKAPHLQAQLLKAEDVDREIEQKKEDGK